MKLKKGVDPKKTHHFLIGYSPNGAKQHRYRVRAVANTDTYRPSGEPVIYLSYVGGKTEYYPQQYVSMPLSMFVEEAQPVTEADIFWKQEKKDVEIQTEEI